ncbi:glycoside hydrolase family 16 protein [Jatrophihabitans sp. YIM 134969]
MTTTSFVDDFDGDDLDPSVWVPHYLPEWSSRAATAATYAVRDSALHLSVPPDQGLWLPGEEDPPLRVSGVMSGSQSGPVGSTTGQQRWREGALVREEQEPFRGWLPDHGVLGMRARMSLSPRSMAAWWLVGFEEDPDDSGEICVWEIFGDAVEPGVSAEVGCGLKQIRDPDLVQDFAAPRVDIDVEAFHTYEVDWDPRSVTFSVDGVVIRTCSGPPTYPMQMMVAVFDFPARSSGVDDHLVPELVVDRIWGPAGPAGRW